jgi:hypothetical protein
MTIKNVRHFEFLFELEETRFAYVALGHFCLFTIYKESSYALYFQSGRKIEEEQILIRF